jgi:hypothetical protein
MNKEIEQLDYEDALVLFNSMCEQYGARQFLKSFKDAYPMMFQEVYIQMDRVANEKKIPALFLKDARPM